MCGHCTEAHVIGQLLEVFSGRKTLSSQLESYQHSIWENHFLSEIVTEPQQLWECQHGTNNTMPEFILQRSVQGDASLLNECKQYHSVVSTDLSHVEQPGALTNLEQFRAIIIAMRPKFHEQDD